MKLSICMALASMAAIAQTMPIKVVSSECPIGPFQRVPFFRNGYCILTEGWSAMVWAADGRFAFPIVPRRPDNEPLFINDIALIPDTGFVLATFSRSGSGLVLLDENGVQRKFIPTGFKPAHIAISEDHSIWIAGSSGRQSTDHMLIHKYSASGEQIAA